MGMSGRRPKPSLSSTFGRCASKPGLAPAGDLLFFVSPKKPKEKKGGPMVWVLPLRFRQPAVLAENGVSLELAFGSDNRSS